MSGLLFSSILTEKQEWLSACREATLAMLWVLLYYKVFSMNTRLNHEISNWLSAGANIQGTFRDQEKASSNLEDVLRAGQFGKLYNEDGTLNPYPIEDNNKIVNLLLNNDESVYRNNPRSWKIYVQPYIRITPLKGLLFESRLNASYSFSRSAKFIGYGSYEFYDKAGIGMVGQPNSVTAEFTSAEISNSNSINYTWENILTYNFKLLKDHDITLTAVTSWSRSDSESSKSAAQGITSNTNYWTNLGSANGLKTVGSGYSMTRKMGYVGRLNYSYLGRYLFASFCTPRRLFRAG